MQELLKLKETNKNVHNKYELNVDSLVVNQVTYGTKNLISFGPKIWNSLPQHIKPTKKILKSLKTLLIVGKPFSVTLLFVIWKIFHKNLLDLLDGYYNSTFW